MLEHGPAVDDRLSPGRMRHHPDRRFRMISLAWDQIGPGDRADLAPPLGCPYLSEFSESRIGQQDPSHRSVGRLHRVCLG